MILDWEVGGGEAYYNKRCKNPVVPAAESTRSGVTIGIGWDCGQNSEEKLTTEWGDYLDEGALVALKQVVGLRSMEAKAALPSVQHIEIGWPTALEQFQKYTVPRHWAETCSAFPGVEAAPQAIQDALMCLVFNRGPGMEGERRREMREIRVAVDEGRWGDIPASIRGMKRLWPDTPSLQERREAEAAFIEEGLAQKTPA